MPHDFPLPSEVLQSPLSMLCFYDEDIEHGRVILDDWQRDILHYFGGVKDHVYGQKAIRAMLLAANGSGKSQFIIAPLAVWMMMKYQLSLTYVTTASGKQLDEQDLRYITLLANKINTFHNKDFAGGIILCQYRKFRHLITESFCDLVATDEGGRVEGKHPLKFDGKFCIIVDEGKTVSDEIFDGLDKCTGITHRLDVSSAGKAAGQFYRDWNFEVDTNQVYKKRITSFDCKHLNKNGEIDEKIRKRGIHDPFIRNTIFSEFNSSEQQVIITRETIVKSVSLCNKWYQFGPIRAGLDLAAGGDENSFTIWHGNKELETHSFVYKDTNETVERIISIIRSYKGLLRAQNVYADDGGVGRGILDNFRKTKDSTEPDGYAFTRILNQSTPYDGSRYANRGAELWWNFKRFVEEYQVLFLKDARGNLDEKLLEQFSNRYYFISDAPTAKGKIQLESKQKAKKNGHPSPDRADGVVLAWSPYIYPVKDMINIPVVERKSSLTNEELAQKMRQRRMDNYWKVKSNGVSTRMRQVYNEGQMAERAAPQFQHGSIFTQRGGKYC